MMMPCHFYAMLQQSMPLKISVRYWYLIFTLYVGLFLPNWMLTDVDLMLVSWDFSYHFQIFHTQVVWDLMSGFFLIHTS